MTAVALRLHRVARIPMNLPASQPPSAHQAPTAYSPYTDPAGLGVRTIGSDTFTGELLEVLRLTPDLGSHADIEPLVRERCTKFAPESLSGLAPVVRIERSFEGHLEIWSKLAEGFRLSAVLEWCEERGAPPSADAALTIGDRLLGALASLQALDHADGASGHGAIAIDQIIISESGVLTLTDYALGTSLASLQWPREKLWRRFRIALPPAAGLARFDHRVDVTQAAVVIASLLAGRVLKAEEYPRELPAIVAEALQRVAPELDRDERDRLGAWLRGATELDARGAFKSAALAREGLREVLGARVDDTAGIARWLRAVRGMPEPAVEARPAPRMAAEAAPAPTLVEAPASDLPTPSKNASWIGKWFGRS